MMYLYIILNTSVHISERNASEINFKLSAFLTSRFFLRILNLSLKTSFINMRCFRSASHGQTTKLIDFLVKTNPIYYVLIIKFNIAIKLLLHLSKRVDLSLIMNYQFNFIIHLSDFISFLLMELFLST